MEKYITGFFMTWGNFFSIPCPCKRWDSRYTSLMLGFLPLIGLLIGIIWAVLYYALVTLGFPFLVVAFFVTLIPIILCGFMHMDGFMDVSDAIMSRRDLAERQRILKDSNTGAFAVISVIFMIFGYFCFLSTAISSGVDFANMVMIVVVSRAVAALHVLICKPMQTSQYTVMQEEAAEEVKIIEETEEAVCEDTQTIKTLDEMLAASEVDPRIETGEYYAKADPMPVEEPKKTTRKEGIILLCIILAIITVFELVMSMYVVATIFVIALTALGTLIAIQRAKKNLAGMNGDIAGYGIVWGELIGAFALVLC